MNKKLVFAIFFLGIGLLVWFFLTPSDTKDLNVYAERALLECKDADYRPSCYDFAIPTFMDEGLSMEEAFEVTRLVQDQDPTYFYCHVLGHYLSAKETAKDPSKWKDVVARAPSGICSNGAIHGAFQEYFRANSLPHATVEELAREFAGVCDPREGWRPTDLERASCIHALGHLTMYATEADIDKSLSLCDVLIPEEQGISTRMLCYDGAFMQIYQPLEEEDFALIEGKEIESKKEAEKWCDTFSHFSRGSCVSESWPLYREDLQKNPQNIGLFCDRFGTDSFLKKRCLNGVFYVLTSLSQLDVNQMSNYCARAPEELRAQCFANTASRFIEVDWRKAPEAVSICQEAEKLGLADQCYQELVFYAGYNYRKDSEESNALCELLPEAWVSKCKEQNSQYIFN